MGSPSAPGNLRLSEEDPQWMSRSPAARSAGASSPARWGCSPGARDAADSMRSREAMPNRLARRSSSISRGQTIGGRKRRFVTGSGRNGAGADRSALPALWEGGWALLGLEATDVGLSGWGLRLGGAATPMRPHLRLGATAWAPTCDDGSPPDRLIAIMKCPRCQQFSAVKDVLWGEYRCPCGWRSR